MSNEATKHIGVYVFDDVEELDVVGPWEVLSWWCRNYPEDGYRVSCFSDTGGWVRCAKGLEIRAHQSRVTVPELDVLIYPGGVGTRALLADPDHLNWVRGQRETVPVLASVCTGALVYAAAGVLRGRPATTHHTALELLTELDGTISLHPRARFIDDGAVITSAGVSAGIDMALHLVARLSSPERAAEVRHEIQYDGATAT